MAAVARTKTMTRRRTAEAAPASVHTMMGRLDVVLDAPQVAHHTLQVKRAVVTLVVDGELRVAAALAADPPLGEDVGGVKGAGKRLPAECRFRTLLHQPPDPGALPVTRNRSLS